MAAVSSATEATGRSAAAVEPAPFTVQGGLGDQPIGHGRVDNGSQDPVGAVGCRALREPVSELVVPGKHGGGSQAPELDTTELRKNVQPQEPVVLAAGGPC